MGIFDWIVGKVHPQVELLTAEAEGGSVQAQLDLANAYAAKKRVRDAAKWFEAAAPVRRGNGR